VIVQEIQPMKFKDYYHSLGKKKKCIFYALVVVSSFSILFTTAAISLLGIRYYTISKEKLPLDVTIPPISLKDDHGRMISPLEGPPAKKLFLFFSTDCPACRMELANLQHISKIVPQEKIKFFLISQSPEEETRKFLKSYTVNFPTLMDPENSLRKIFKFHSVPAVFLLDENNIIKYGRIGYKKLAFDERLIREFAESAKIPIEIFGPEENGRK
jgi:peroxiredoxin